MKKKPERQTLYVRGKLIEMITLNYCSTAGLIHADVLPQPPLWKEH
jgi:hypothetical protein